MFGNATASHKSAEGRYNYGKTASPIVVEMCRAVKR